MLVLRPLEAVVFNGSLFQINASIKALSLLSHYAVTLIIVMSILTDDLLSIYTPSLLVLARLYLLYSLRGMNPQLNIFQLPIFITRVV